jgi:hypothetical protein
MKYEDLKKYFEEQKNELKRLGLYAPLVLLEENMDRLEEEMKDLKNKIKQDLLNEFRVSEFRVEVDRLISQRMNGGG